MGHSNHQGASKRPNFFAHFIESEEGGGRDHTSQSLAIESLFFGLQVAPGKEVSETTER